MSLTRFDGNWPVYPSGHAAASLTAASWRDRGAFEYQGQKFDQRIAINASFTRPDKAHWWYRDAKWIADTILISSLKPLLHLGIDVLMNYHCFCSSGNRDYHRFVPLFW